VHSLVCLRKTAQVHRIKRKSLIGQLILVALGIELLLFTSFTSFDLPTPTAGNLSNFAIERLQILAEHLPPSVQEQLFDSFPRLLEPRREIRYSIYVPLVPMAILLGYALGWPLGACSAALFLCLGLIGPFFGLQPLAAGGGIDYYMQPGFGYLLGLIVCAITVGLVSPERRSSLSQILALGLGLITIHLVGLLYMLGLCLFFAVFDESHSLPAWLPWLFEQARNLTWYSLPYDFAFSLVLIGVSFPIRWLAATLVAPDIAVRSGPGEEQSLS